MLMELRGFMATKSLTSYIKGTETREMEVMDIERTLLILFKI